MVGVGGWGRDLLLMGWEGKGPEPGPDTPPLWCQLTEEQPVLAVTPSPSGSLSSHPHPAMTRQSFLCTTLYGALACLRYKNVQHLIPKPSEQERRSA